MDFLNGFSNRMKKIGAYGLLFKNSIQKGTWKQFGFDEFYEQTNVTFSVLLYIMEQSLKDEICTMDDIGGFLDTINMQWLKKPLSYEQCTALADFIVNVILCDEGRAMYFHGFQYERGVYEPIHISFLANRIVYIDEDIRRTSYYLTDDGYQLMLSTLEIEGNMHLTMEEMVFKLHLEKATYDRAVEDIKNIFSRLQIQCQKIRETMHRIRQNALTYSVSEYRELLLENLSTVEDTKRKFLEYREHVQERINELEEKDINIRKLGQEETINLKNLHTIEWYLSRSLDEHQKILNHHFDLKALYENELEELSQMAFIQRFSLRRELYEPVLSDACVLKNLHSFFRPLFSKEPEKTYNLNRSLNYRNAKVKQEEEDDMPLLSVEDDRWEKEEMSRRMKKQEQYKQSLFFLLDAVFEKNECTLREIRQELTVKQKETLIPTVEVFQEIIVELLKCQEIILSAVNGNRGETSADASDAGQFNVHNMLASYLLKKEYKKNMKRLFIQKQKGEPVAFEQVNSENGRIRKIRCSDIRFQLMDTKQEN